MEQEGRKWISFVWLDRCRLVKSTRSREIVFIRWPLFSRRQLSRVHDLFLIPTDSTRFNHVLATIFQFSLLESYLIRSA